MSDPSLSRRYHQVKIGSVVVSFILDVICLLAFFLSGLSRTLKDLISSWSPYAPIIHGLYILVFFMGMYVIHFPVKAFCGYVWERKFNLSNQTFSQWLVEDLKKSALGLILIFLLVQTVYVLLGRYPQTWWVGAGAFWITLSLILAKITPQVIIPIFFKYIPIESQMLKERIFKLFRSCHVPLKDIYMINLFAKTKKANAFLCGLGKSQRVVLSDTLVKNFSDEEIEVVVAHELGHYLNRDIFRMLAVNAIIIFIGLYGVDRFLYAAMRWFALERMDDIAFFPVLVLVLMVLGLAAMPVSNGFSRLIERKADQFSLQATRKKSDFISLMKKLGDNNLADYKPSALVEIFFYDHPPVHKRIAFAERFPV